jgi:hypothetical protein
MVAGVFEMARSDRRGPHNSRALFNPATVAYQSSTRLEQRQAEAPRRREIRPASSQE